MLAAIVVVLATAGAVLAQMNVGTGITSSDIDVVAKVATPCGRGGISLRADIENESKPPFIWQWRWGRHYGPFCGGFGPKISVSEEFKENVINIAENDSDVQNLLDAGYENVSIRPIIKATVQGNGDITKATGAILTLCKEGGRALVQVDLEAGKVTKIVKVEWTVIEKS